MQPPYERDSEIVEGNQKRGRENKRRHFQEKENWGCGEGVKKSPRETAPKLGAGMSARPKRKDKYQGRDHGRIIWVGPTILGEQNGRPEKLRRSLT